MNIKEEIQNRIKEIVEYGVQGMKWGEKKRGGGRKKFNAKSYASQYGTKKERREDKKFWKGVERMPAYWRRFHGLP